MVIGLLMPVLLIGLILLAIDSGRNVREWPIESSRLHATGSAGRRSMAQTPTAIISNIPER